MFIPPKFESPSGGLIKPSEYLRSLRPDAASRRNRREAQVRNEDDGEGREEGEEAKYEEVEGGDDYYSEPVEPGPPKPPHSHGEPLNERRPEFEKGCIKLQRRTCLKEGT